MRFRANWTDSSGVSTAVILFTTSDGIVSSKVPVAADRSYRLLLPVGGYRVSVDTRQTGFYASTSVVPSRNQN
ncbi:MAG: hypothetical protein EHM61_23655 [Acidobacteria bacterium]|nr:MAG: hypothetical protein EHM61_23655 [Acidobacteriota bacterium]